MATRKPHIVQDERGQDQPTVKERPTTLSLRCRRMRSNLTRGTSVKASTILSMIRKGHSLTTGR